MIRFLAFFLLAALTIVPVRAADDLTPRDSVDYTLDDGIMSQDEMEDEARYIHAICSHNSYQRLYFNCDCVAGAFLAQREKLGPMGDQVTMLDKIMRSKTANCANTPAIAGNAYETCMGQSSVHRELAKDNPDYCGCVANKIAREFKKAPMLDISYIESMTIGAMIHCNKPQNRKPATKPGADTFKIPN